MAQGSVIILEPDAASRSLTRSAFEQQIPDIEIFAFDSLAAVREQLKAGSGDVVVIDETLPAAELLPLIYELRNDDQQPAVVMLTANEDPQHITYLYKHGCQRCIIRDNRWRDEASQAVRHLLRLRQLEYENLRIRTKLTEANLLLEERNRRLDEFSATLAHDIRGPLGGISMKLEYLLETHEADLPERCKHLVSSAFESTQRLTGTVQAMYDFAKLGAKAQKVAEVNLAALVEQVIVDLRFDPNRDIQISIEELPVVWGNPDLLGRVFLNLIGNAVKFNDKPQVQISIRAGDEIIQGIGRFREIIVADNGIGIDSNEVRDVLSMFRRGSNLPEDSEGSGVGLTVVQRIVELHFGKLRVESTKGSGTIFVFTLPLEPMDFR